ncbi:hypothetical protein LINGRAHAP2_LOCUS30553 [Linum grandiflorum]
MDPQHLADTLKHLDKQDELLSAALDSMKDELTKLRAEEGMLMQKFCQLKNPRELILKNEDEENHNDGQTGQTTPLATSGKNKSAVEKAETVKPSKDT